MRKTEKREVEVNYCDFCGKEAPQLYQCVICGKEGCLENHWRFSFEMRKEIRIKGTPFEKNSGLVCIECANKPIMLDRLIDTQFGSKWSDIK